MPRGNRDMRTIITDFQAVSHSCGTDTNADMLAIYPALSVHSRWNNSAMGGVRNIQLAAVVEDIVFTHMIRGEDIRQCNVVVAAQEFDCLAMF